MGLLPLIAALSIFMMIMRGFYWNVFERGEGIWTANRMSALSVFAVIYFAPDIWRRFRNVRS